MKQKEQITANVLMVRPANFGFNEETAASNAFQNRQTSLTADQIRQKAIAEFDAMVQKMKDKGINVTVVQDSEQPIKPDAVFPNNWVTFHANAKVILYPMHAPVRRLERQEAILDLIEKEFEVLDVVHLENNECIDRFLEGTGSMILDRVNDLVYACLSPRTDTDILEEFCQITGYEAVVFHAVDAESQDIYHTNVMMALGETFAVICLATITDATERELVLEKLKATEKDIIDITLEQMMQFGGNMLQLKNDKEETFLVMSKTAFDSLTAEQIAQIESHTNILWVDINTIETFGGGSARCMIAEIFLPHLRERSVSEG